MVLLVCTINYTNVQQLLPIKRRSGKTLEETGDSFYCATYTHLLEKGEQSKFLYLI